MNTVYCVNCMKPVDTNASGGRVCPHCGFDNKTPVHPGALPYHTMLRERYALGRVIHADSEGLSYAALDTRDDIKVTVREFYPSGLVFRDNASGRVSPSTGKENQYGSLLQDFANMARGLTRLRDSRYLTKVLAIFRENNTVYIVCEHQDSMSLREYIEKKGILDWNSARELFVPILSSLSAMHAMGVKHLAISPDSLRVCRDGKMRLGNFGTESLHRLGTVLESDLVPGCAAYEQYSKNLSCGETTDVYGYTASLVFALSGQLPAPAPNRAQDPRLMLSRDVVRRLPQNVVTAIAGGLQVNQEDRIASFERMRAELSASSTVKTEIEEIRATRELPAAHEYTPQTRFTLPPKFWLIGSFLVTALVLLFLAPKIINSDKFNVDKIMEKLESQTETSFIEVIRVPKMEGASYNDWINELKDDSLYKFSVKVASQEFSEEVPEGYIISQDPAPGENLEKGGVVSLVISRGSSTRTLPAINGKKFTDALEMLEAEGFEVVKEETYSRDALSGVVLWYVDYSAGDTLPYGSVVKVLVSIGVNPDA